MNMRIFVLSFVFALISQGAYSQTKPVDSVEIESVKANELIVYGSNTCHYCIDTKSFLKEKNITFIYYDIDANLEKQNEMIVKLQKAGISLDTISLPIVDLNGKLIMNNVADFDGFLIKLIEKTK
jgi:glutaredoxin